MKTNRRIVGARGGSVGKPVPLPCMTTYSGRKVNPLYIQPEDVCLEDIAHALALVNRFAGHTKFPISVAQHSVYVSRLCTDDRTALQGLLHDASEAYLGDVTKWLKQSPAFKSYRSAERRAHRAIMQSFELPEDLHPEVEEADRLMVRYEAWKLMPRMDVPEEWQANYLPPTPEEVKLVGAWAPWSWREAEDGFLAQYRLLQFPRVPAPSKRMEEFFGRPRRGGRPRKPKFKWYDKD